MPHTSLPADLSLTPFPNVCCLQGGRSACDNAQGTFQKKLVLCKPELGLPWEQLPLLKTDTTTYVPTQETINGSQQGSLPVRMNTVQAFFSPQGHGMLNGAGTNLARKADSANPNKSPLPEAERAFAWINIQWAS